MWSALLQVLLAVAHLHQLRILHGDLKPSNVLIAKRGVLRVVDFGISEELTHVYSKSQVGGRVGDARGGASPAHARARQSWGGGGGPPMRGEARHRHTHARDSRCPPPLPPPFRPAHRSI